MALGGPFYVPLTQELMAYVLPQEGLIYGPKNVREKCMARGKMCGKNVWPVEKGEGKMYGP